MSEMLLESQDAPNRVEETLKRDTETYTSLAERLKKLNPSVVGTIARGSSDHAAGYAKYLIPLCTGRLVASIPPSVVSVLKADLKLQGQFVLALSQSGGSPDIIGALEKAKSGGALTAAMINQPDSALSRVAEVNLPQNAGVEKSITATKSVLCTLAGIARLTALWASDKALLSALEKIPDTLRQAAMVGTGIDEGLLKNVSHAFVLSRGLGFGAATELALKFKETCGIHAEAFSAAEVRHGPREIVGKGYLVIALALPGSGEADVVKASQELRGQGAKVLVVGAKGSGADFELPEIKDHRLAPLAALQLMYPWIARSAVALGRNPDKPKTLADKVIKTV